MTAADAASPDGELGAVGLDVDSGDGRPAAPPLVVRCPGGTVTLSPGQVYRIGRDPDGDVVVDAPVVSWRHAQLLATAGQWLIQDAGSTNGTFCGGQQVSRMQITGTVQFRLGHPEGGPLLVCSVPDAAPAALVGAGQAPATHAATALWPGHSAGRQAANGDHPGPRPDAAHRPGRRQRRGHQGPAGISPPRRTPPPRRRPLPAHRQPAAATAPSSTASGSPPRWSPRPT